MIGIVFGMIKAVCPYLFISRNVRNFVTLSHSCLLTNLYTLWLVEWVI